MTVDWLGIAWNAVALIVVVVDPGAELAVDALVVAILVITISTFVALIVPGWPAVALITVVWFAIALMRVGILVGPVLKAVGWFQAGNVVAIAVAHIERSLWNYKAKKR
jgi:hypothetical protein